MCNILEFDPEEVNCNHHLWGELPQAWGHWHFRYQTVSTGFSKIYRPVLATGFVFPTATKGRPPPPEPAAYVSVSQAADMSGKYHHARDQGMWDRDKGHIIALELGGPNIPHNITPQFSRFQQSGEWRKMERDVLATAKAELKKRNLIRIEVVPLYSGKTFSRGNVASEFSVSLFYQNGIQVPGKSWNIPHERNVSDWRRNGRLLGPDENVYMGFNPHLDIEATRNRMASEAPGFFPTPRPPPPTTRFPPIWEELVGRSDLSTPSPDEDEGPDYMDTSD